MCLAVVQGRQLSLKLISDIVYLQLATPFNRNLGCHKQQVVLLAMCAEQQIFQFIDFFTQAIRSKRQKYFYHVILGQRVLGYQCNYISSSSDKDLDLSDIICLQEYSIPQEIKKRSVWMRSWLKL